MAIRKGSASMVQLTSFFVFTICVVSLMASDSEKIISAVVQDRDVSFKVTSEDSEHKIYAVTAQNTSGKDKTCSVKVEGKIKNEWKYLDKVAGTAEGTDGRNGWRPFDQERKADDTFTNLKLEEPSCK